MEMDDIIKRNAEHFTDQRVKDIFVLFLRAVALQQYQSHKAHEVAGKLFEAMEAICHLPDDKGYDVLSDAISTAIAEARKDRSSDGDEIDHHMNNVMCYSAKVLAERISGVLVQETRAKTNVFEQIRYLEQARDRRRWR